jgi:CspA family cold shock protein
MRRRGKLGYLFEGMASMPQGKIKKVIADKGFGFIEGERGDIFFHHSALDGIAIEALQIGQSVTYEEGRGPKGPRAENVRLA